MKPVCMTLVLLMIFYYGKAQLQNLDGAGSISEIKLTTTKTTSLIFPQRIRYVDRGTRDVLVSKVSGAENILLLKAAKEHFAETNLSVVTGDGAVHSFTLNYEPSPKLWVYHYVYSTSASMSPPVAFKGEKLSEAEIASYAAAIEKKNSLLHGVKDRKWRAVFGLGGLYIKENVLFFSLHLSNVTLLDYDIEKISFFIRDKKKAKRTAVQEQEIKPMYVHGNITSVKGGSNNKIIIALPQFTLPKGKYLAIEVVEKSGGRHMLLKVRALKMLKAVSLPVIP